MSTTTAAVAPRLGASEAESLWQRARDLIIAEITAGALAAGSRLAPERELCRRLDISRVTLRRALHSLVDAGYVTSSHGRGWYVSAAPSAREWPNSLESFSETARRMQLDASSRVIRAEVVSATLDDAEMLGLAPGSAVLVLDRVRLLNDVPIAVDRARLSATIVPGLGTADFATQSLFGLLDAHGVEIARAEATIEARDADVETAALLSLRLGDPILIMRQLQVDRSGRPVLSSDITYSGERYRLRTVFTRGSGAR